MNERMDDHYRRMISDIQREPNSPSAAEDIVKETPKKSPSKAGQKKSRSPTKKQVKVSNNYIELGFNRLDDPITEQ
jgi:hypothetical protein